MHYYSIEIYNKFYNIFYKVINKDKTLYIDIFYIFKILNFLLTFQAINQKKLYALGTLETLHLTIYFFVNNVP